MIQSIAPQCIKLCCSSPMCITLHHSAFYCITVEYIALHCVAQPHPHCIALYCITVKSTNHCITVHCTVLHSPTPRPGAVLVGATSLSQVGSAASAPCFAIHCNALFLEVGSVAHSIAL